MDATLQILQGIGYLFLLTLLIVFWRKVVRREEIRSFWMLFAMAWTLNLLGNIAWAIHDVTANSPLDTFSAVDLFYISRYLLLGIAIWLYPNSLKRQTGIWAGVAITLTALLVWTIYFNPAMRLRAGDWVNFLGLAIYPILDALLIVFAWFRFRSAQGNGQNKFFLLLLGAMVSYGIANTLNLTNYVFPAANGELLPNIFWILTDTLLLALALGPYKFTNDKE
ncbi:MAG: hypothetical protein IT311_08285 [Anaerolineales bacterium]|nr:hypothetical protein [Anaerolineales bacterium]MCZ2122715.1 hypothetical protein [Anaerolineales bacterium]